jgi:menaquinone-dependent protoporphyrinogen oxidase
MKVLVGFASKYGSTDGIAEQIAGVLSAAGHEVDLRDLASATAAGHDAFVLGSAVYAGNWLKSARRFVAANAGALGARPVWLFSSGPVGDPPKPDGEPTSVATIRDAVHAREHRIFAGKIERQRLNIVEKALTAALKVPDGDFRGWDAVRAWAEQIDVELRIDAGVAAATQ